MAEEIRKEKQFTRLADSNQTYTDVYATTWIRYPYGVRLQTSPDNVLDSIIELERYIMKEDLDEQTLDRYLKTLQASLSVSDDLVETNKNGQQITSDKEVNYYFNYPNFTDTRVGCNDAINPYWQFNRDDDICPPPLIPQSIKADKNFSTSGSRYKAECEHATGMGRVYAETYDAQQQIVWFEAGIPKFTNLITYYRDAMDANVASIMNTGDISFLGKIIGGLFKITAFVVTAGLCSLFYISRWIDRAIDERITKYYSFSSTMTIYYAMVNSMLQYTAVSMGLHPLVLNERHGVKNGAKMIAKLDANPKEKKYEYYETITTDENGFTETHIEKREVSVPEESTSYELSNLSGIPEVLKDGVDIFKIMNRKSRMIDQNNATYTVEELIDIQSSKNDTYAGMFAPEEKEAEYKQEGDTETWSFKDSITDWWSTLKGSVLGSGNFVGFKVEKGGFQPTEQFTNNTGPTGLADKINSESKSKRDELDEFGGSKTMAFGAKLVNAMTDLSQLKQTFQTVVKGEVIKGAAAAISGALGFDIGTVLQTGNGFLEIPKVWKDSSMGTRSYTLNFKLRSRYGDPVSIFQSIYIPLFLLIALSIPRAAGAHSYTSPFILRAFCKGMFFIPVGIVTSLSITRGRDEYGWSSQYLPLEVNVSMTIEDLSPQMFVSMNYGALDTFTKNATLQSYLEVLSSLGLRDMIYWYPKVVRKTYAALATAKTTIFNPSYYGTQLGKSRLGKLASALVPFPIDRASGR